MAKYFKRIGTKAEKYAVEINIEKVELKLATAARISVTFQRGTHKAETKNAPNLEDGFAEFDESLILPVTFYHDVKKGKFLEKQGLLSVSIMTKKGAKLAGQTKFDLAEYLNNEETEKNEVIPILKCLDKEAKFHFTIKFVNLAELENELSGGADSDESGEERAKTGRSHDDSSEIRTHRTEPCRGKNAKDRKTISQSPAPKGKITGLGKKARDSSSDSDSDTERPPPKKSDRMTRNLATKSSVNDRKAQTKSPLKGGILGGILGNKGSDSSDSDSNIKNKIVGAIGMNILKNKAMDMFGGGGKKKSSDTSDSEEEKANKKGGGGKAGGGLGGFLKNTAAGLFNGKKEDSSASSDDEYERREREKLAAQNKLKDHLSGVEHNLRVNKMENATLQKKYDALLEENEELKEELAELRLQNERLTKNYEKAKLALENKKDVTSHTHTVSTNDPEVEFYKDKIEELEAEIAQLKKANANQTNTKNREAQGELAKKYEELEKKYKSLELELKTHKEKAETLEKESIASLDTDKVSFDKYKKLNKDYMALKEENDILKAKNEELENTIQEKDNHISDLEAKIKSKDEEIADMQLNTTSKSDKAEKYLTKIAELERKNRALEEAQNKKGGKQDKGSKGDSDKVKQLEDELAKLGIENEGLKKQLKDVNAKLSNFKYDNKQVDELKKRNQELEHSVKVYEKDLTNAKMNWASDSDQKEKLEQEFEDLRNENEKLKFELSKMSENLLSAKTNLGTIMNAIFEHGGPELFDQIEGAISFGEYGEEEMERSRSPSPSP